MTRLRDSRGVPPGVRHRDFRQDVDAESRRRQGDHDVRVFRRQTEHHVGLLGREQLPHVAVVGLSAIGGGRPLADLRVAVAHCREDIVVRQAGDGSEVLPCPRAGLRAGADDGYA